MSKLSPAAQAVLTAVTQQEYCLDPSEIPTEAARIGYLLSAAFRAVADQVVPIEYEDIHGCWYEKKNRVREQFLAIANELEAR